MGDQKQTTGKKNNLPRSSVRIRVLAGLVLIMIVFSGLTIYSIFLHQRTVEKIGLINSSYLPLILGTSEISANQVIFNVFLDRLADDPNQSVTREWIDAARRFRPSTLRRLARTITSKLKKKNIPQDEARFLFEMRKRLRQVVKRYLDSESKFQKLYELMDTGRIDEARVHIEGLKRAERNMNRVLSGIGEDVENHITELADEAAWDGARATWGLGLLTLAGILIAVVLLISTNHMLAPLRALTTAVGKVARGNLQTRIDIANNDELGALAAGFNRMTEALIERDQMLIRSERLATAGKMAAQVTHEIRNPLSSLGLNAELLDEELGANVDKNEARTLLRAMQDEIERLTGITESYLRFARMPTAKPDFNDLNVTVESVLDFMKNEINEHKIAIQTDLDKQLSPVLFDRAQIKQALTNLVRNACEAMPDGGTLTLGTMATKNAVELTVKDTGIGIADNALESIYKSFYSTKSSGTGLGLPLVRQICLAHGGDVHCDNHSKQGTTFIITIPRPQASEGQRT
jgi:two-component system, NtrC family, sensor kinase